MFALTSPPLLVILTPGARPFLPSDSFDVEEAGAEAFLEDFGGHSVPGPALPRWTWQRTSEKARSLRPTVAPLS
eukprot:8729790-Pyramimonas_sp.AAC.1